MKRTRSEEVQNGVLDVKVQNDKRRSSISERRRIAKMKSRDDPPLLPSMNQARFFHFNVVVASILIVLVLGIKCNVCQGRKATVSQYANPSRMVQQSRARKEFESTVLQKVMTEMSSIVLTNRNPTGQQYQQKQEQTLQQEQQQDQQKQQQQQQLPEKQKIPSIFWKQVSQHPRNKNSNKNKTSKLNSPTVAVVSRDLQSCFHQQQLSFSSLSMLEIRGGAVVSQEEEDDDDEEEDDVEEEEEDDDDNSLSNIIGSDGSGSLIIDTTQFVANLAIKAVKMTTQVLLSAFESGVEEAEGNIIYSIVQALSRMWNTVFGGEVGSGEKKRGDALEDYQKSLKEEAKKHKKRSKSKKKTGQEKNYCDDDSKIDTKKRAPSVTQRGNLATDFGSHLSELYGVDATRNIDPGGSSSSSDSDLAFAPILGGTLTDALLQARSQARLLVVMIPVSKPHKHHHSKHKTKQEDLDAIKGFLSIEVATVAERKAMKKATTSSASSGSFLLWSAQAGSAEAAGAVKRLKALEKNSKGRKRPILAVAYPARIPGSPNKLVPRLLAQHHCSPPPSPELMAAWLNALRKRHAKQYAVIQNELQEDAYYRQRTAGYKDSVQSDKEREVREEKEAQEKLAREQAEKERTEAIEQRRNELKEQLPDEPEAGAAPQTVITVALRTADGRSATRRFNGEETKVSQIFNWADVEFEVERETLVLTTFNGKKSYEWAASLASSAAFDDNSEDDDSPTTTTKTKKKSTCNICELTLTEAGFARMTGLRLTQNKKSHN